MRSRLLHPVDVVVRNIDTTHSDVDEDFEEPTELVYQEEFTVKGQVRVYHHKNVTAGGAGYELLGDGYILMTRDDAEAVEMNAEIVSIAGNHAGHRVVEKRPAVHYGMNEMVMVYYEAQGKSVETR